MKTYNKYNKENLTILLYHGVTKIDSQGIENYSGKHISENNFREQMALLKNNYNVISIDEVVDRILIKKEFAEKSVVVTFDDGFENNYNVACPILDHYKIPAVFYICSGMIGNNDMMWVDKIEACINHTPKSNLKILLDQEYDFIITDAKSKVSTNEIIKKYCKNASKVEKDRVVKDLIRFSAVNLSENLSNNYKMMNWNQLLNIKNNSLFTIGGHSMYHDILTSLPDSVIFNEISSTIDLLKQNLNLKIFHYSYPEGQEKDFNENIINILKSLGIICCPSAIYGYNNPKSDLFHLNRIMVGFMNTKFPLN